jgi:hypothetical protein
LVTTLIDTPGFNDKKRSDTELLESIVDYIHRHNFNIIAVIYLHRVTERKLTGSTMLNLRLLRAICGEHYFRDLVLATTMWSTVPAEEMNSTIEREVQLNTSGAFWDDMLAKGAQYIRWDETRRMNDAKTAEEIVRICDKNKEVAPLNILLELEKGCKLEDTAAHQILTEEMKKRLEREKRALEEEEQEIRYLEHQKRELLTTVERERENVRRESEVLERVERAQRRSSFMDALTSFTSPLRRGTVDSAVVYDTRSDRDYFERGHAEGSGREEQREIGHSRSRRSRSSQPRYQIGWIRKLR